MWIYKPAQPTASRKHGQTHEVALLLGDAALALITSSSAHERRSLTVLRRIVNPMPASAAAIKIARDAGVS
jgi:hypothetical protein